jgi:hypothetical protein
MADWMVEQRAIELGGKSSARLGFSRSFEKSFPENYATLRPVAHSEPDRAAR